MDYNTFKIIEGLEQRIINIENILVQSGIVKIEDEENKDENEKRVNDIKN